MNELKKILKPLRLKIIFELYLKRFFTISSFILIFDIFIEIFSKFKPLEYKNYVYFVSILFSFIVPIIIIIFKDNIDYFKTAKKCDTLGYKERIVTAYEILLNNDVNNGINKFVIEDAFNNIKDKNISKQYKIIFPKKFMIIFSLLIISMVFVGFIEPYGKENFSLHINREIDEIKKIEQKSKKNENITNKELKDLKKILNSLDSNLKKSLNKDEAKKVLEKTEQELKKLEKNSINKDISKTLNTLSKNNNSKSLANAIENGNQSDIEKAIEQLNNISDNEKEEIKSNIEKLNNELSSEEIKNSMNLITGNNLSNDDIKNISSSLSSYSSQGKELRNTINDINKNISSAKNDLENNNTQQNSQNNNNQGSSQQNGNNGNSNSQGLSSQNGNSNGMGRGRGEGEHEEIYSRDAMNKNDKDFNINGVKNETGEINISNENTIGNVGNKVNYSEVYNEYKEEAIKSMETNNIPYGMRDIVTDYFSILED